MDKGDNREKVDPLQTAERPNPRRYRALLSPVRENLQLSIAVLYARRESARRVPRRKRRCPWLPQGVPAAPQHTSQTFSGREDTMHQTTTQQGAARAKALDIAAAFREALQGE